MGKVIALAGVLFMSAVFGHAEPPFSALTNSPAWEWRPAAPFGGPPTWFSAAFTIGDMAYVGTGYGANNEFWRYDAGRDAWTRRSPFPGKARGAAIAFSSGEKGYLGLGYSEAGRFADLWEYNPATDRWTLLTRQLSNLVEAREFGAQPGAKFARVPDVQLPGQ